MPAISQDVVDEAERLKVIIGWSWIEITSRFKWTPQQVKAFRTLKVPISDGQLDYLRTVAEAVESVPLPERDIRPATPPVASTHVPGAAHVQPETTQVRVMMLDDIAAKLNEQYWACAEQPDISAAELTGARWVIGALAEKFGVTAELRALIQQARPAPPVPVQRRDTLDLIGLPMQPPPPAQRQPFGDDAPF